MKLSDFKGEDAVEVLADIMEPATSLLNDTEFKKMVQSDTTTKIELVQYVMRQHTDEVLQFYSILNRLPKETATPIKLTATMLDIFNDKELVSLFTSQAQNEDADVSGLVTENTTDAEQ